MGETCFFIGHRDTGERAYPALAEAVERQIVEHAVADFVVGRYGRFDEMAARAVREAKARHQGVTLTLLLPYHPFDGPRSAPTGCDGTFYPPGMERTPKRLAILRANRYMVDHCGCLIAWVRHPGSARDLLDYARRRERRGLLRVENLAEKAAPGP